MNDAILTLLGSALIVAVPSGLTAFMQYRNRQRIEATHDAVKVINGLDREEPLGDYVHRRMHMWDGRLDLMVDTLERIDNKLGQLVDRSHDA